MFILLQLLQITQDFYSFLDPANLVKFIILPLDKAYLLTDKVNNIFMVIEKVLQINLIIEFYVGAFLE